MHCERSPGSYLYNKLRVDSNLPMRTHNIYPDIFPEPWASDWGEDEYGLWMAFTYKGVRQCFRWMEPGTFMIGSPKNEPERYDDEDHHEVTLTQGSGSLIQR